MAEQKIEELEAKVKELEKKLAAKEKICAVLIRRVERSVDSVGGAYSIFERNILLQNLADRRAQELEEANRKMAQEISERKRAEEEVRESEEKYRAFFETSRDCVFITTRGGRWIDFNDAALRMFGFETRDELRNIRIPDLYEDKLDRHLHTEKINHEGSCQDFAVNLRKKDGSIIHTLITTVPKKDNNGEIIGYQGTIRDVTDQRKAEEARQKLEDRLHRAEKMEVLGTLAGSVAHDLNNVLGILIGYSELLLEMTPEDSPLRNYATHIFQSGQKGSAIIQDMLTLARRGVSVLEVINPNTIISGYFKTPEFEKLKEYHPGVTFETDLGEDLLNIKCSPVHVEKTIMNLVSNAAESISGTGKITIRTENCYLDRPIHGYDKVQEGDYVVLRVSDNGKGIPSADLNRIFEPFFTKKVMGRSGTGLGLTVVWGTVKDHNGYIDVQSTEDKGSSFALYFPASRESLPDDKAALSRQDYRGRGERILVVDDVEGQRLLAASMLSSLGYNVDAVASGEEAVKYVKIRPVDLVVLDMIMEPGLDGLETYRRIVEICPAQKAIIVSGFAETQRVRAAQDLGAGPLIKKPYIMEKIGLAVRKELDRM